MDKNLFIHFGIAKTGTTAIQQFLLLNKKILASKGIYVPSSGMNKSEGSHHPLAFSLSGERLKSELYANVESPEHYKNKLKKEIESNPFSNVLLTSEIFPACVDELNNFVNDVFNGWNKTIIIYLRKHDHLYESEYIQAVKNGSESRKITDFIEGKNKWNFLRFIKRVKKTFSPKKIIVRPYEKIQLKNENIIDDFMFHVFNIDELSEYGLPKRHQNPTLNRDAMEFKRILNKLEIDFKFKNAIVSHLITYSEEQSKKAHQSFTEKNILNPEYRYNLVNENLQDYIEIAKNYCTNCTGNLFHEPLPSQNESWQEYPGISPNKVLEIAMNILKAGNDTEKIKQKLNSSLIKTVINDLVKRKI